MRSRFIAVFGSSSCRPGDEQYEEAVAWGRCIATAGFGVINGGYMGAMEAVSKGAAEAGAQVIGVTVPALFPDRDGANPWVSVELPAPSLLQRIAMLCDLSVASVTLRGSIGTLAEVMAAWNIAYIDDLRKQPTKPVGVHASWMPMLTTGHVMRDSQVRLITPIASLDDLAAFCKRLG
ncbi:MAG: LOG family protein [Planctomycetota bacterium]